MSRVGLRPLGTDEMRVVKHLIREADETIADMELVLGPEDVAVVRHARDWLRGIQDTGVWTC
jgi:hypothetical protein